MVMEHQSPDMADPLAGYFSFALFPRTFRASTNALKPSDPDDEDSLHSYLKSMEMSSPHRLLEQAKAIVDGGPELLCSKIPSYVVSEDKSVVVPAKDMVNPRQRRPALCRKRARFSLKPNSSLEPSLDIDRLQDPEEFFLAYERFENAKKELQRQGGCVLMNSNQGNPSTTARCRRPGILGRSASYRHRYPSTVSYNDESTISSQETLKQDTLSPFKYSLHQELADLTVASEETGSFCSVANTEDRVNVLLDELLSDKCKDFLDGSETTNLLWERLQIKPVDVENLCLPDLHDIRSNFPVSLQNLPKPKNVLADIQNLLNGTNGKTPVKHKQVAENSVHHLASPTPPKSPFASIPLLKKRVLRSNTSSDPYSAFDIDQSPIKNSSAKGTSGQSDHVGSRKDFSASGKSLKEGLTYLSGKSMDDNLSGLGDNVMMGKAYDGLKDNIEGGNINDIIMDGRPSWPETGSDVQTKEDLTYPSENPVDDNLCRLGVNIGTGRSHGDFEDDIAGANINDVVLETDFQTKEDLTYPSENSVDDNLGRIGVNIGTDRSHGDFEDDIGGANINDVVMDGNISMPETESDIWRNSPNELGDKVEGMPQEGEASAQANPCIQHLSVKTFDSSWSQLDNSDGVIDGNSNQSSSVAAEHHEMTGPSEASATEPEQLTEVAFTKSLNEQDKGKTRLDRASRRKELSRRQSLAGAGTSWESGYRRSTRIKMRPLEFWKGERFLYGRVHKSLTTVIGVKYMSPGKDDGKRALKVKSFVSDEYKELVELAALH